MIIGKLEVDDLINKPTEDLNKSLNINELNNQVNASDIRIYTIVEGWVRNIVFDLEKGQQITIPFVN